MFPICSAISQCLLLLLLLLREANTESCSPPSFTHGFTVGESSEDSWVGSFNCHPGYSLVGNSRLKCRAGSWSGQFPVCTAIGRCDPSQLPQIQNGKRAAIKQYRNSAYRYSCSPGFHMLGPDLVTCLGDTWDFPMEPICLKPGCDSSGMRSIEGGSVTSLADGALFRYTCGPGTRLQGSASVHCDGETWNDTAPMCLAGPDNVSLSGPSYISASTQARFQCVTSPALQPTSLQWTVTGREGEDLTQSVLQLTESSSVWTATGQVTSSLAVLLPTASSPQLSVSCSVTNTGEGRGVRETARLLVLFPPGKLGITGTSRAVAGQRVTMSCSSSPSHPASSLQWWTLGDTVAEIESHTEVEELHNGSFLSSSSISLEMGSRDLEVECRASNTAGGRESHHRVELLRPPGTPVLALSHTSAEVVCTARDGNPPASLVLYRNGRETTTETEVLGDSVSAALQLGEERGASIVICEVRNEITPVPLRTSMTVPASTTLPPPPPPSPSPRAEAQAARRRPKVRRQMVPLSQDTMAGVSVELDIPEDYDYSHFDYLNEKFEIAYTKSHPEPQFHYYSDDYVYYYESEGSVGTQEVVLEEQEMVGESPDIVTFEEETEDAVGEIVTVMESGGQLTKVSGVIVIAWSLLLARQVAGLASY